MLGYDSKDNENISLHIERCIITIHVFIITGKIDFYYNYYKGVNTLGLPRLKKYVWNETKEKYLLSLTSEEYNSSIDYLNQKIKTNDSELIIKFYSPILEFLLSKENIIITAKE